MYTGRFDEKLNCYFGSVDGAYTTVTREEIRKQTFNVKSVIRQILEEKLGKENIPRTGRENANELMKFNIYEGTIGSKDITTNKIKCKYSKPNRNEMTIYFANSLFIPKEKIKPNDKWFIYFKANDSTPWFGLVRDETWNQILRGNINEAEEEEYKSISINNKEINYKFNVNNLTITNTEPPKELQRRSGQKRTRRGRKIDWVLNEKNKNVKGEKGEEIAIEIEKRRLKELGREDLIDSIIWASKDEGDGLGYDIKSVDIIDGQVVPIYIEVKATSKGINEPFHIEANEIEASNEYDDKYYIYRIYDMKEESSEVKYYKRNGSVSRGFDLKAVTYKAYVKDLV